MLLESQKNVILIMYDDLRPELSIYGKRHMHTPNFERLANKSVVFEKAYAQVAVCNPSRASLLTGLRPDHIKVVDFQADWRPHITIPSHLISEGYKTAGVGKIFHWESDEKHIWTEEQVGGERKSFQDTAAGRGTGHAGDTSVPAAAAHVAGLEAPVSLACNPGVNVKQPRNVDASTATTAATGASKPRQRSVGPQGACSACAVS